MKKKYRFRYPKSRFLKDQALTLFFAKGLARENWRCEDAGKWWLFVRA